MKISQLVELLEKLKKQHGDIPVKCQSLSHYWEPEPEIRGQLPQSKYILLNP